MTDDRTALQKRRARRDLSVAAGVLVLLAGVVAWLARDDLGAEGPDGVAPLLIVLLCLGGALWCVGGAVGGTRGQRLSRLGTGVVGVPVLAFVVYYLLAAIFAPELVVDGIGRGPRSTQGAYALSALMISLGIALVVSWFLERRRRR